jgi:hypothetical protein
MSSNVNRTGSTASTRPSTETGSGDHPARAARASSGFRRPATDSGGPRRRMASTVNRTPVSALSALRTSTMGSSASPPAGVFTAIPAVAQPYSGSRPPAGQATSTGACG